MKLMKINNIHRYKEIDKELLRKLRKKYKRTKDGDLEWGIRSRKELNRFGSVCIDVDGVYEVL